MKLSYYDDGMLEALFANVVHKPSNQGDKRRERSKVF